MNVYILLDRSGSMASKWNQTIDSLNEYVGGLDKKTKVYVAAFDSNVNVSMDYDVIRETKVSDFTKIDPKEISPRGMTPLNDASARIINKALSDNKKKTIIVFITDGQENASKEIKHDHVKQLLKQVEDNGWESIFLGVDFSDVVDQGVGYGLNLSKTLNISSHNMKDEMKRMASRTTAYAAGTPINFTDEDRIQATKK